MSFNYNAQADSDESDGDLTAWGLKNVPKTARPSTAAPVAPMMGSRSEAAQVVRDSSTPDATASGSARKRQKTTANRSPVAPTLGFNAINAPSPLPRGDSEANSTYNLDSDASPEPDTLFVQEEESERNWKGKAKAAPQKKMEKKLVVQVSRTEADEMSDYEDLRVGADRVRQVLSEHSYDDGTVLYKVQFADFHDEDVSDSGPNAELRSIHFTSSCRAW